MLVACCCTAIPFCGCAVTDRMDEMNGRMARLNAQVEQLSQAVAKLDETNRHLAALGDQAKSMDKRLATMENVARKFAVSGGDSPEGLTQRSVLVPHVGLAPPAAPRPDVPESDVPAPLAASVSPERLPAAAPPAAADVAPPQDEPKAAGLRVTTLPWARSAARPR